MMSFFLPTLHNATAVESSSTNTHYDQQYSAVVTKQHDTVASDLHLKLQIKLVWKFNSA